MDILNSKYGKQIQVLNSTLWENKAQGSKIIDWLDNFSTDKEKEYALYLLSRLMYFGSVSMRNLLKSLYRDLFCYPIIENIRRNNNETLDENIIESELQKELNCSRFLGVGNPSESGVHLLYYFRQENHISKNLFINTDDLFIHETGQVLKIKEEYKNIKRLVFIDDLCASGYQATSISSNVQNCVQNIKKFLPDVEISYLMLFGVTDGIKRVLDSKLYDRVEAVVELNSSYKCFGDDSRYFADNSYKKSEARDIAFRYGYKLMMDYAINATTSDLAEITDFAERRALGFGDCQLLLSMHHNTPDNTLPIIWYDENNKEWKPIFKRYHKIYE